MADCCDAIHFLIVSQLRLLRIGEMCSLFFDLITSCAAAFRTLYSLSRSAIGRPYRMTLHDSRLDVTKACNNFSQSTWKRVFGSFQCLLWICRCCYMTVSGYAKVTCSLLRFNNNTINVNSLNQITWSRVT